MLVNLPPKSQPAPRTRFAVEGDAQGNTIVIRCVEYDHNNQVVSTSDITALQHSSAEAMAHEIARLVIAARNTGHHQAQVEMRKTLGL